MGTALRNKFATLADYHMSYDTWQTGMNAEDKSVTRRHLLIAGTGRTGTSFLVRYLTELGLDTHLTRRGASAQWDDHADAGLEELPFTDLSVDLPYVIKTPGLYHFVDQLLENKTFIADAVIIPVRDLTEAAASRSIVERRMVHQTAPWMSEGNQSWEDWGFTPGGVIFSLNPIDQGRLLAVGFHHLVQRLIAADIPIIFLSFPRTTEDGCYLFEKLRPILPYTVDRESAYSAHRRVAEPPRVRVAAEIRASFLREASSEKVLRYASHDSLDAIAIRRELGRLRKQLVELESELGRMRTSRSWRLTRPLRSLVLQWRRVQHLSFATLTAFVSMIGL